MTIESVQYHFKRGDGDWLVVFRATVIESGPNAGRAWETQVMHMADDVDDFTDRRGPYPARHLHPSQAAASQVLRHAIAKRKRIVL